MFNKIENAVNLIEEWVISLSVIFMSILLIFNVVMRVAFNHSLTFSEEIGQLMMIIVTFFGLGYCVRKNRHINMSIVYDAVGNKTKKRMMILISAVSAVVMVFVFILSVQYLINVFMLGKSSPALRIPMFLFYLSVPIGFFFAAIEYIRTLYTNIKHKDEIYLSCEVKQGEYIEEMEA